MNLRSIESRVEQLERDLGVCICDKHELCMAETEEEIARLDAVPNRICPAHNKPVMRVVIHILGIEPEAETGRAIRGLLPASQSEPSESAAPSIAAYDAPVADRTENSRRRDNPTFSHSPHLGGTPGCAGRAGSEAGPEWGDAIGSAPRVAPGASAALETEPARSAVVVFPVGAAHRCVCRHSADHHLAGACDVILVHTRIIGSAVTDPRQVPCGCSGFRPALEPEAARP